MLELQNSVIKCCNFRAFDLSQFEIKNAELNYFNFPTCAIYKPIEFDVIGFELTEIECSKVAAFDNTIL